MHFDSGIEGVKIAQFGDTKIVRMVSLDNRCVVHRFGAFVQHQLVRMYAQNRGRIETHEFANFMVRARQSHAANVGIYLLYLPPGILKRAADRLTGHHSLMLVRKVSGGVDEIDDRIGPAGAQSEAAAEKV